MLGSGTMGSGIATTLGVAGHSVVLFDVDIDLARRGVDEVARFLDGSVRRKKLTPGARDEIVGRFKPTASLADLAGCDVVVEAIPEDLALKQRMLAELDEICRPDALFHTNTSTLSVAAIAAGSSRPERVVGTHYCNPAALMKLVEAVPAEQTSDAAFARTLAFLRALGKLPVVTRDSPGFLVNYFWVPFENDCIRALEAGLGTVESIDRALKHGLGFPMGTFELLDIVGLDVHRAVSQSLYDQLRDPRFAPPPLVDRRISAGLLGRKSGRGFYDDTTPPSAPAPWRRLALAGNGPHIRDLIDAGAAAGIEVVAADAVPPPGGDFDVAVLGRDGEPAAAVRFIERGPGTRLAEVVAPDGAGREVAAGATATLEALGWPAVVARDRPGYLVDRLHIPFLNQILQAHDDRLASAEDIDTALVLGLGHRIGGLELVDAIGLDVHRRNCERVYAETGDRWFKTPPVVDRLIRAGRLGAGRGAPPFA